MRAWALVLAAILWLPGCLDGPAAPEEVATGDGPGQPLFTTAFHVEVYEETQVHCHPGFCINAPDGETIPLPKNATTLRLEATFDHPAIAGPVEWVLSCRGAPMCGRPLASGTGTPPLDIHVDLDLPPAAGLVFYAYAPDNWLGYAGELGGHLFHHPVESQPVERHVEGSWRGGLCVDACDEATIDTGLRTVEAIDLVVTWPDGVMESIEVHADCKRADGASCPGPHTEGGAPARLVGTGLDWDTGTFRLSAVTRMEVLYGYSWDMEDRTFTYEGTVRGLQ